MAHLIFVSAWGGVVLGETVLELAPGGEDAERMIARVHFWIDMLVELPLIVAVVGTGAALAARVWPPSPLLWAKLAAGLVAAAANLYCVGAVVLRTRAPDAQSRRRWTQRVRLSALAIPFAAAAAGLGLAYFRR